MNTIKTIAAALMITVVSIGNISASDMETSKDPQGANFGTLKEYSILKQECENDKQKVVYERNDHNQLLSKTVYRLSKDNSWALAQKYEYRYNSSADKNPSHLTYNQWNANGEQKTGTKVIKY